MKMTPTELNLYTAGLAGNNHRTTDGSHNNAVYWAACAVLSVRRGPLVTAQGHPTTEEVDALYEEYCAHVAAERAQLTTPKEHQVCLSDEEIFELLEDAGGAIQKNDLDRVVCTGDALLAFSRDLVERTRRDALERVADGLTLTKFSHVYQHADPAKTVLCASGALDVARGVVESVERFFEKPTKTEVSTSNIEER